MTTLPRAATLAPPLKWAGGKRWLVPTLRPIWPGGATRLVEPFAGGLAVALGLQPARALLNDANAPLIRFYEWLQRGLILEGPLENDRACYEAARARFNELLGGDGASGAEAAKLFYYLNRTGFNGLCRFNRHGRFNVPFGRYTHISYTRDFTPYQAPLAAWTFHCGDFAALELASDDWVYADPPYDVEFTTYSAGGFGWPDQVRLAGWLSAHPGPVVASNQATARVLALYRDHGFTVTTRPGPRRIACNGDRTPAVEMLAWRGLTPPESWPVA